MLNLRPYQEKILDGLREGFAAGHAAQVLYAPTGGGKTEIACAMMAAASAKGTRSAMVLDRIVLCDQTSRRLDKYKVPHGVMQAGHWRYRPEERIQVCSAQTLEARGSFPGLQLLIVDECHNSRVFINEFIQAHPQIKVVGLSATPFTKGLGAIYSNVVAATTTEELVGAGFLVPLRVFVCKQIDMTGAKKVAGEWSDKEATERGIKISGDVVSEWVAKTTQVFGGPRKTIVFCAGVAHGAALAEKFSNAGYNFVSISYKDDDEFKRQAIEEFSKPDSTITGLIATDILTKGFDVPDVMVGISARPFTKSLSSHIQQLGRVMRPHPGKSFAMWLCMARGSRVLTDQGLVPIEQVSLSHRIWDGTNFVSHGGAVCNGIQPVITYQGLTATRGHLVHTAQGWRTFGYCAREQIAITQAGLGEQAIRVCEDHFARRAVAGRQVSTLHSCGVRVREVWASCRHFIEQLARRANAWLPALQPAGAGVPDVALWARPSNAGALSQPEGPQLSALWRAWREVSIRWGQGGHALDHAEPGAAEGPISYAFGSHRPSRPLRAGEPSVVDRGAQPVEQARQSGGCAHAQIPAGLPGRSLFGQHAQAAVLDRADGCGNRGEVAPTFNEAEREVWDILDAGPLNRFTCEGLLVHNCHSGNYIRFQEDWETIYSDGPGALDDGREKPKNEPNEKQIRDAKCPSCGVVWPPKADTCPSCGHVRQRRNDVIVVAGEMHELAKREKASRDEKQRFYSELIWVARERGYKPGWVAYKYQAKFGAWPRLLDDRPISPSFNTLKWLQSQAIRWAKSGRV